MLLLLSKVDFYSQQAKHLIIQIQDFIRVINLLLSFMKLIMVKITQMIKSPLIVILILMHSIQLQHFHLSSINIRYFEFYSII